EVGRPIDICPRNQVAPLFCDEENIRFSSAPEFFKFHREWSGNQASQIGSFHKIPNNPDQKLLYRLVIKARTGHSNNFSVNPLRLVRATRLGEILVKGYVPADFDGGRLRFRSFESF